MCIRSNPVIKPRAPQHPTLHTIIIPHARSLKPYAPVFDYDMYVHCVFAYIYICVCVYACLYV